MTVHIHAPAGFTFRSIRQCRKCRRRTRHLVSLFVWYEPLIRCLACHPKEATGWSGAMTKTDAIRGVCEEAMAA